MGKTMIQKGLCILFLTPCLVNAAAKSPKDTSLSNGLSMARMVASPMVTVPPPTTMAINLAWNSSGPGLSYKVYYGTASRTYTNLVTSNTTTATVSNLNDSVDYYFSVTSVNSLGVESNFSNEVTTAPPSNKIITFFIDTATNLNGPWLFYTNIFRATNPPASKFMRLRYSEEFFY